MKCTVELVVKDSVEAGGKLNFISSGDGRM